MTYIKKIDLKSLKQARVYQKKGLGIREIARLMKKDPTQIIRWLNYYVDISPTYPQKKVRQVLTGKK